MDRLRRAVYVASLFVFLICVYVFLRGNRFFEGKFENDIFAWYFLAKGIFCSVALILLEKILESCCSKK